MDAEQLTRSIHDALRQLRKESFLFQERALAFALVTDTSQR